MTQRNKIIVISIAWFCQLLLPGADAKSQEFTIGFYNLENLFDTIDDPLTEDEEFTPLGEKKWTFKLYQDKLKRLANVIDLLDSQESKVQLALLGVSEIENEKVLEDLCNTTSLNNNYFKIVHHESPDLRGIDVALLYRSKYFTLLHSQSNPVNIRDASGAIKYTRDVLLVKGLLLNQMTFVFVNHWPSRRAGEESIAQRMAAARVNSSLIDSVRQIHPDAAIIIMGDLNDNPDDESILKGLHAKNQIDQCSITELYNPFYKNHIIGEGTTPFNDSWNLFDQIIISGNLLKINASSKFHFISNRIFRKDFMIEHKGHYKNHPKRSFSGNRYNYGYSDHFPVVIKFREGGVKGRRD